MVDILLFVVFFILTLFVMLVIFVTASDLAKKLLIPFYAILIVSMFLYFMYLAAT